MSVLALCKTLLLQRFDTRKQKQLNITAFFKNRIFQELLNIVFKEEINHIRSPPLTSYVTVVLELGLLATMLITIWQFNCWGQNLYHSGNSQRGSWTQMWSSCYLKAPISSSTKHAHCLEESNWKISVCVRLSISFGFGSLYPVQWLLLMVPFFFMYSFTNGLCLYGALLPDFVSYDNGTNKW